MCYLPMNYAYIHTKSLYNIFGQLLLKMSIYPKKTLKSPAMSHLCPCRSLCLRCVPGVSSLTIILKPKWTRHVGCRIHFLAYLRCITCLCLSGTDTSTSKVCQYFFATDVNSHIHTHFYITVLSNTFEFISGQAFYGPMLHGKHVNTVICQERNLCFILLPKIR